MGTGYPLNGLLRRGGRMSQLSKKSKGHGVMADGGVAAAGLFEIQRIERAPIKKGERLDDVLLYPDGNGDWTVGAWSGEGWYDGLGSAMRPLLWAFLPAGAALAALLSGGQGLPRWRLFQAGV